MRRGFTLIEALTVISVIGILASLVTVSISQAQRFARDAKRKSDLTVIAFGLKARYEDKTCSQSVYLGESVGALEGWVSVASLYGQSADEGPFCDVFANYLRTLPSEPRFTEEHPYAFNLSNGSGLVAKHFRLTARLERPRQTHEELDRHSRSWQSFFGGQAYPLATPVENGYNYFIGD